MMISCIKKIFPNYKTKKELRKEINTLRTDKQLAIFYERMTKPPIARRIEYDNKLLNCQVEVNELVSQDKLREFIANRFVSDIESLIEIEEVESLRNIYRCTRTYRGVLVVGKRRSENNE